MAISGNGIRDTARALRINPTKVIEAIPKNVVAWSRFSRFIGVL
ncbi:MAG: hypothetical protein AAFX01_05905 [Cyanobacteria bacterium J06638_28]